MRDWFIKGLSSLGLTLIICGLILTPSSSVIADLGTGSDFEDWEKICDNGCKTRNTGECSQATTGCTKDPDACALIGCSTDPHNTERCKCQK
jgi:hypothetical protein